MFNGKSFDLISIGDTQYDVFLELEEKTKIFHDDGKEYLGVVFRDKIPVKSYTPIAAVGNAANVAIGSARLGLKTAFYTHLALDHIGKEELKVFRQEGVSEDYIIWDKKEGSNFSAVLNYQTDRTILVHHKQRPYKLPAFNSTRFIYLTSMASGDDFLLEEIGEYVKKTGLKLLFNPGSLQLKKGLQGLKSILEISHVLFVNKEEAQFLLGIKDEDPKALMKGLKEHGPEIIVMTDDGNGSYSYDGSSFLKLDIFKVPVVEMTGAGDAYAIGFAGALAYGKPLSEAMRWGAVNSGFVIQYIGAREGLLSKKKMEELLLAHPQFQPQTI